MSTCGGSALGWDAKAQKLLARGPNRYGELGLQDNDTGRWLPVAVPPTRVVTQIAAGSHHSLILADDGTVLAAGRNDGGALGLGSQRSAATFTVVPIPATSNGRARAATFIAVAPSVYVGDNQSASYVVTSDTAFACGNDAYGKLGRGEIAGERRTRTLSVIEMPRGERLVSVSAGKYHVLGVTRKGLFAWGSGEFGKLGLGDDRHRRAPTRVDIENHKILNAFASESFSLALTARGEIFSWGKGTDGQLGRGKIGRKAPKGPIKVEVGDVTRASTTDNAAAIVKSNGDVMVWGHSIFGNYDNPTRVCSIKDATKLVSIDLTTDKMLLEMRQAKRPLPPLAAAVPPPLPAAPRADAPPAAFAPPAPRAFAQPPPPPALALPAAPALAPPAAPAPAPPAAPAPALADVAPAPRFDAAAPSPVAAPTPPGDDVGDGADTEDEDTLEPLLKDFIQSLKIPQTQRKKISHVLLREGFYSIEQLTLAVEPDILGSTFGFPLGICMLIKKKLGEL